MRIGIAKHINDFNGADVGVPPKKQVEELPPTTKSFLRVNMRNEFKNLPEGIYIADNCDLCGACVSVCVSELIRWGEDDQIIVINNAIQLCPGNWDCGKCVSVCKRDAITVKKAKEHIPHV